MTQTPSYQEPETILVDSRKVSCNGGGGALGHPLVWYEMGDEDMVECMSCLSDGVGAVFIFDNYGGLYERDMCYFGLKSTLDCWSDPYCISDINQCKMPRKNETC